MLAVVQVPEHGDTVLATGSGQGSVGGDGEGVDVAGVTKVVGLELASVEFPDLCAGVSIKFRLQDAARSGGSEILVM